MTKEFLEDIPMWSKLVTTICIYCDSMTTQVITKSNIYNGKLRHIRCKHNTIKQLFFSKIIYILIRKQINYTSRGMRLKSIA